MSSKKPAVQVDLTVSELLIIKGLLGQRTTWVTLQNKLLDAIERARRVS